MHRDVQPRRIELEHGRDELPRQRDRFALVVVAEAEIPQHLEERAVPPGAPDVLDVALRAGDAQAALHGHRARRGRGLIAEENRDELLHAGDREERGGHLIGNEAGRGHQLVLLGDKEVDPSLAEFLAFHGLNGE